MREREQWKEGEGCERESGEVRGREMGGRERAVERGRGV